MHADGRCWVDDYFSGFRKVPLQNSVLAISKSEEPREVVPKLILQNVCLEYPVYDAARRSLTTSITRSLPVGGQIKSNKGNASILALDNINLDFHHGDRVALLGHNGAGKTSLLKLLSGFYEPTKGSIIREGKISALLSLMAGMDINISGYDNIVLCCMLHGISREEALLKTADIAEFSELGSYLEMPLRTYSEGMRLRLSFAISTSIDSDILLLDEWIGAGDQSFIEKAKARLSEFVFRSSILVFATHNPAAAGHLCTKAIFLEHGKVLKQGTVEEVLDFQQARH